MGVRILWGTSGMPYTDPNQNQLYPPNLLAMSGLSVVYRSLSAMGDIPTRSSNPNTYSLLQSYLMLLIDLKFQKGNIGTPVTVPLFPLECSY